MEVLFNNLDKGCRVRRVRDSTQCSPRGPKDVTQIQLPTGDTPGSALTPPPPGPQHSFTEHVLSCDMRQAHNGKALGEQRRLKVKSALTLKHSDVGQVISPL